MSKAPQAPGPALQGWGRTIQKRRLEYETYDDNGGKRNMMHSVEYFGPETRATDALMVRTYFNYPQRIVGWQFNWWLQHGPSFVTAIFIVACYKYILAWNDEMMHLSWW